jgi:hypothetical protein
MRLVAVKEWCYVLAFALAVHPVVAQQLNTNSQNPADQSQTELSAADLKRLADEMERGFKALEAAAREIPRDTFDPRAVINEVGQDPAKLLRWVRDHTFWVPYRGSLRGPIGVLMDRLGNSLDRSLLLAELLRTSGPELRLAHAELTEAGAKALLPKLRPVPKEPLPAPPPATKRATDELLEKYAKQFHLDLAKIRPNMEKMAVEQARLAEDIVQRVAEQAPAVAAAVGMPKVNPEEAERAAEVAALRDHWWIEMRQGTGWTALDPALPDAVPRATLTEATEYICPNPKTGNFNLKSSLCHEVQIRVVVEQWQGGRVKEQVVLNQSLRPSQLFGVPVVLRHIPLNWPNDLNLIGDKGAAQRLKAAVLAQREWLPVLSVGTANVIQSSFKDTGDVNTKPILGRLAALARGQEAAIGNIGRALENLLGGTPKEEPKPQLSAEWIEYEIRTPGQPVRKVRRHVFELVGPAARSAGRIPKLPMTEDRKLDRGLPLLGQTEILLQPCMLSDAFVASFAASRMLANRNQFPDLIRQIDSLKPADVFGRASRFTPPPGPLYDLALARQAWCRSPSDVYLNRSNVASYHSRFGQDSQGRLTFCHGFDIVANDVAARAGSATGAFLLRLEQGVLDTNAEAVLMAACGSVQNTAELFRVTKTQGINWHTIRSTRDPALQTIGLSSDARSRIEQELASGSVVVVPTRPVKSGDRMKTCWWSVDALTGQTLGIAEDGTGSGVITEEAALSMFLLAVSLGMLTMNACIVILDSGTGGRTITKREIVKCAGRGVKIFGTVFGGFIGLAFGKLLIGVLVAVALFLVIDELFDIVASRRDPAWDQPLYPQPRQTNPATSVQRPIGLQAPP